MSESVSGTSTPWRREPQALEAGLAAWARELRGPTALVSELVLPSSGMANDTVLFRLDGERLVARLAPAPGSPYPTFPSYDFESQQRVIELVRARSSVPVPEIVELERSPRWLGVPFLVTRFADGLVAGDSPPYLLDPNGWFRKGSPEQWQRFEHATIDVIARLHRIPGDDAATAFLLPKAAGDSLLAQHLAEHHAYYDWARDGHVIPVLERAYAALAKTLPRNARRVLNWGDSRPGNILYRDFEPVLVLDWEMASGGPPELDIAWLTFFQKFYAGMGARYGVQVPAMFGHAETRAIYERLAGEKLGDLTWYEALAGYRFGIIVARMMLRSAAFGQQPAPADPDELVIFKPLLEELVAAL